MNCDYLIAIPSYKRAQTLKQKTLAYLEKCKMNLDNVRIFVANEEEQAAYAKELPGFQLIVGAPGITQIRNFIQSYFATGQKLLCMDDDIEGLFFKVDDKRVEPLLELDRTVHEAFELCALAKCRLWGINAVLNPYFMKAKPTFDLKFIVGCTYGCINDQSDAVKVTTDEKEDYERTIKYYLADGAVVRLNWIAPQTKYYTEPGGLQLTRTLERISKSAHYLHRQYPQLVSLALKENDGRVEIRLRDKRKGMPPLNFARKRI